MRKSQNSVWHQQLLENLEKSKAIHSEPPKANEGILKRLAWEIEKANGDDLVRLLFSNFNDWVGLVYDASYKGLKAILAKSGKDALAQVEVDAEFDLENPRAVDYLNQHAMEDSNSYSDTIKEDISLRVQEGVENGNSVDQIASSISQYFNDTNDYRTERIARTETINAYGAGNLEGYKQSGVVIGKYWIPDAEACPICVENGDASPIPLDDDFPSGDDAPTAHPNAILGGQEIEALGIQAKKREEPAPEDIGRWQGQQKEVHFPCSLPLLER